MALENITDIISWVGVGLAIFGSAIAGVGLYYLHKQSRETREALNRMIEKGRTKMIVEDNYRERVID